MGGVWQMKEKLKFRKKNLVSCANISMWKVLWEYFCWVLAGKPEENKQ